MSAEEDATEWRGFRDGADLRLGAIEADLRKQREGERETTIRKSPKTV